MTYTITLLNASELFTKRARLKQNLPCNVIAMSYIEALRIFFNKDLLKNEPEIFEDDAKYVLTFSQIIAKIINLWPSDGGPIKKVFFVFMVITGVLQELSLILHLLTSELNVDVLIKAIASMMIIMQVCLIFKKSLLNL